MISRMKSDIARLNNTNIGKEINRYTIAPIFIWMYVWFINKAQMNYITGEIALVIIFLTVLCGCVTALKARKNKTVFILFKVISIWMMSLGLLSVSYTSYYVFLKFKGILFLCVTLLLYLAIFTGVLIMVRNKAKQKEKRKKERNNKTILIGTLMFFTIGYFIIGPMLKQTSQSTMHIVLICLGTLISYILVACSPYYLVEYMISKRLYK